ncbi:HyaD/HybD family hydrogenase maturation endopeptidase [Thiorhodospira sibirica]|uniref:HyaD/HybD family hydrogenase maturation endopeptidase n=1 Tax=Thiorhodospira sibirica TaxID=154347 RepID=UPI0011126C15|nr:HyaD/HybD family hydrogenase maturation endopeptidase [Thiorhodospira sibirica]
MPTALIDAPCSHTLVLGLGNTLLSDEGAGVYVVRTLAAHSADFPGVQWMDGGTLGFALADAVVQAHALIVVDTANLEAPAGTVRVFEDAAMDEFVSTGKKSSVHEVSLNDLLAVALLEDRLPRRRALVGIQPLSLDWGEQPSAAVQAGMLQAAEAVKHILQRWQHVP